MTLRIVTRATLAVLFLVLPLRIAAATDASAGRPALLGYADVLRRFVTTGGRVRYAALKADRVELDAFVAGLAAASPSALARVPEAGRIAFWVNAYNAITLVTIIDHYPIHASGLSALFFPASSIRQISSAWSARRWTVLGRRVSLDEIENQMLRKQFHEPRIHMALVCAAMGCPPLRNEPYDGAHLVDQLDDQARRYLASPSGLRLQPDGSVAVSSIFKWFGADFGGTGGLRAFLLRYAPQPARAALENPDTRITYLDYDWSLNEARGE